MKALNEKMKADGLQTGATKNLRVTVADTSGTGTSIYNINLVKGSVAITAQVERAHNVTAAQAAAFQNGTKTISQVQTENLADSVPDAFTFVDQTNSALSTLTESAAIVVAGINTASAISIAGGEYQINGGAWVSVAGTVNSGDSIKVRHTTSASNSTSVNSTLTIGGVSDVFTTTTLAVAVDSTPPNNPTLTTTPTHTNGNSVSVEVNGEVGAKVFVGGVDTGSVIAGNGKVTINLDTSGAQGAKNFAITLRDAANNISGALNLSVTKDTVAPTLSSSSFPTLTTK